MVTILLAVALVLVGVVIGEALDRQSEHAAGDS